MGEGQSFFSEEMRFIARSAFLASLTCILFLVARNILNTAQYHNDVEALNSFIGAFGVMYGAMISFIVFEVWSQFNRTNSLVNKESLGLRNLFRLTLYFKEGELTEKVRSSIKQYVDLVIVKEFPALAYGRKHKQTSHAFDHISKVIKDIEFDDHHDPIVFDHFLTQYQALSEVRTERIEESLTRVPPFMKIFNHVSSFLMLAVFVVFPFESTYYGLMTIGVLTFVITLVLQMIEELDNPFFGHWNLTPRTFELAAEYIETHVRLEEPLSIYERSDVVKI